MRTHHIRARMTSSASVCVCYHYPCIDGAFSALAAHLHFQHHDVAVRFFPLTVYSEHSASDLQLTVNLEHEYPWACERVSLAWHAGRGDGVHV